jgi:hypothetical protein
MPSLTLSAWGKFIAARRRPPDMLSLTLLARKVPGASSCGLSGCLHAALCFEPLAVESSNARSNHLAMRLPGWRLLSFCAETVRSINGPHHRIATDTLLPITNRR